MTSYLTVLKCPGARQLTPSSIWNEAKKKRVVYSTDDIHDQVLSEVFGGEIDPLLSPDSFGGGGDDFCRD